MNLSKETVNCRHVYETTFDPASYLNYFADDVERPVEKSEAFFNSLTHKVFSEGKVSGSRCVDIGGGPTVHRLAIASPYVDILYSSDFLKANRDFVNTFLHSSSVDPVHISILKTIAQIEGFQNTEEGANAIAQRLKAKLQGSIPCDVLEDRPLGDLEPLGGPFDVVISNGCLETACTSLGEFKRALRNISSLLKPKGVMLLMTYLDEDFYDIYKTRFPVVRITKNDLEESLKEAGFNIEFWECFMEAGPEILKYCNTVGFSFVHATKGL